MVLNLFEQSLSKNQHMSIDLSADHLTDVKSEQDDEYLIQVAFSRSLNEAFISVSTQGFLANLNLRNIIQKPTLTRTQNPKLKNVRYIYDHEPVKLPVKLPVPVAKSCVLASTPRSGIVLRTNTNLGPASVSANLPIPRVSSQNPHEMVQRYQNVDKCVKSIDDSITLQSENQLIANIPVRTSLIAGYFW